MSNKENPANEYRAERKKRLSKKKKNSTVDSVKVVSVVISIIAAIAVISLVCFGLYEFGIPQKVLPAVKVGDRSYSVAEYGFYYTSVYQSMANQQQNFGIKTFELNKTTTDEDGNQITYDQLIRNKVLESLEAQNYYLDLCEKEGLELNEEYTKELDSTVDELAQYAKQNSYSTSRLISVFYGKGLNEKTFRNLLHDQMLVSQYLETQRDECFDISDEKLEEEYAKDPTKYLQTDIRLFGIAKDPEEKAPVEEETTSEDTTDVAEATTEIEEEPEEETDELSKQEIIANEMLNRITDEESFIKLAYEYADEKEKENFAYDTTTLYKHIKYYIIEQNIGKDMADWLVSSDRKAGDKTVYSGKDFVYVVYLVTPAYRDDDPTVNIRNIFIPFDAIAESLKSDEENKVDTELDMDRDVETSETEDKTPITNKGTGYSMDVVTETYKMAHEIYSQYQSGEEQTEDAFIELEKKYGKIKLYGNQNDTAPITYEKDGKYEEMEAWAYDENRQPGDTGLVMTNRGWSIMYFIDKNDIPAWKNDIKMTLGSAAFEEIEKEVEEQTKDTASEALFAKYAGNEACKLMSKLYESQPAK